MALQEQVLPTIPFGGFLGLGGLMILGSFMVKGSTSTLLLMGGIASSVYHGFAVIYNNPEFYGAIGEGIRGDIRSRNVTQIRSVAPKNMRWRNYALQRGFPALADSSNYRLNNIGKKSF